MAVPVTESHIDAVREALTMPLGAGADLALNAALTGVHPADIAEIMEQLSRPEALAFFSWLDNERASEVLDELDHELTQYLLSNAPHGRIAHLLELMPMDDAAEVIGDATPEQAQSLLASLHIISPEDAAEVRELLSYPERTAGRLMTDKFVRVAADMTIRRAIRAVRRADPEVETLTDIYVVASLDPADPGYERLVGVFSLRELIRAKFNQTVAEIMTTDVVSVTVDTDQEEVARVISKYDFLALPVQDRDGLLCGIVTIDDVLDILVEEQTEDVLKMGAVGTTDKPYMAIGVVNTFRRRIGWLLLLFITEMLTGSVLRYFGDEVAKFVALSFFIPLLIGTGGNAGSQTVSTIIRALALGEIRFRDWLRVFWRETRTGMLLGLAIAVVGYLRALMWGGQSAQLGLVVAISLIAIVVWANMVGSLLPIGAKRLGIDPAVMSAPFIATLVDATGLVMYFSIARWLLHI